MSYTPITRTIDSITYYFIPVPNSKHWISDDDRVVRITTNKAGNETIRPLIDYISKGIGYWTFTLNSKATTIHRAKVMAMVSGPLTRSQQIDHIDQNKLNNNISNLRVVSCHENRMNSSNSKLTINEVKQIWDLACNGAMNDRSICKAYGMNHAYVSMLRKGWYHNAITGVPNAQPNKTSECHKRSNDKHYAKTHAKLVADGIM